MTDQHNGMPDFDEVTTHEPPKRHRKKAAKPVRKPRAKPGGSLPKTRAVAAPKRARKKRMPRKLPGRTPAADAHLAIAPPNVSAEAAGAIRAYMALDEAQRAVVLAFLQALR